jgi:hypothetical protein
MKLQKLLEELKKLNTDGILLVGNRVINSSHIPTTLIRIASEGNTNVVVLEHTFSDDRVRSIRCGYYAQKLGLKSRGKPWRLKAEVRALGTPKGHCIGQPVAFLVAANTYQEYVLGVFPTLAELEDFRTKYYDTNKIRDVVIASNQLTKDYYENN